jgi:DNA primase
MDQVAQIREKLDIVSLISEFVPLKKAGRNFKANCPFHSEKTPSFMVSPDRQTWHCFGSCNKGGDIYSFVMEYERLEFPEALRMLAKRAGIELVTQQISSGLSSKKERMYQINTFTKEYYHYVLTKHKVGERALGYLKNRGVTEKIIETFQIGFAPTGNSLSKYLMNKKQFTKEELVEAGVAFQAGRDTVDFFRDRLMFPLIDHRDNVVGFAGRILDKNDNVAKYVNTRETLVYHKGEHLFGINVTKEAMRRENHVLLVEGEFDVISCFQHGIGNVLAVKGTALTEQQVNLLGRFAQKVTFCFDGDKAGQEAIKRSLVIVEKKGLTPTVIKIPGGKDPDEALQNEPGLFKKAVKEDIGVYDYLLEQTLAQVDIQTAEGKKEVSEILLPFIAEIKNEIIKEHYLRKLSTELGTSYESITRELDRLKTRDVQRTVVQVLPKVKRPKEEILEDYLLAMIVQGKHPKELLEKAVAILSDTLSKERASQKIMYYLLQYVEGVSVFDGKKFGDSLPQELIPTYDRSLLFPLPELPNEQHELVEVEKLAKKLRLTYLQQQLKKIATEIKEKEKEGKEDEVLELKKEYSDLATLLDME